ncbi:hypothetical protein MJG53_010615 [Ovis ammon polii x Ovis aries]|uniref:Uncharacterized protein n=1 Tax=Ovis ammon polii x Ovis aries TaxID=2918886 RepID=A0ACB9UU25_9CETA|nr:hypothetical protein MJG53_010615 [Ovis ammon polii x Ovis aries]
MATPAAALSEEEKEKYPPNAGARGQGGPQLSQGPEKVGSQPRGADETGPTSTKRKGDHPAAQPGKPSPLGASLFSPATCEFPAHSAASPSPERREAEESRSRTGGASRLRPR